MRNSRVLEKGTIEYQVSNQDQFILVISDGLTGINLLNQRKLASAEGRITLIPYTTNDLKSLPDQGFYYESIDAIFWGDVSPDSLRPTQIEAIKNYIKAGGCLIAWGGPASAQFEDTWMESVLPVRLGERMVMNELPSLVESFIAPIDLERGWVIGAAQARTEPDRMGEVFLKEDTTDLLVRGPLGLGWTTYVAFDLTSPQFALWPAAESFLDYLLQTAQVRKNPYAAGFRTHSNQWGHHQTDQPLMNCYNSVQHDPVMLPPSFQFISAFLLIYVLLVGPVNYLVLRHKKRLELTWVTIPCIVLLFLGLEYTMGWNLKGKKTIVNSTEILLGQSGDTVLQHEALIALFSPAKRRYEVDFTSSQGRILPLVFNNYEPSSKTIVSRQTQRISLDQYPMNMWTMEAFWAQGQTELEDPIICELKQIPEGIQGQLKNLSTLDLKHPCIVWDDKYYALSDVAAGQTLTIFNPQLLKYYAFDFTNKKDDPYKDQRVKSLYEFLKTTVIDKNQGTPFFFAWVDQPESIRLGNVSFDSRRETLLALRLSPPEWDSGLRYINILDPRYQVNWMQQGDNLTFDQYNTCHFTAGTAQAELVPVNIFPKLDQIHEMNLRINLTNRSKIPLQLELYDWKKHRWIVLLAQVDELKKPVSLTDQNQFEPIHLLRSSDQALRLRFKVNQEELKGKPTPAPYTGYGMSQNDITVSNLSLQIKGKAE